MGLYPKRSDGPNVVGSMERTHTMSTGDTELTQDVLFDILSSARRRFVLHVLKQEGEMELTELAEHVAARENEVDVADLTKQERKRVYVSLYQTHVPKLSDAGLVEYDEDSQLVSLRADADGLARYLGTEPEPFPWQYVYLTLALAGVALVTLSAVGVPPVGGLSGTVVAFVFAVALLLTATAHVLAWVTGTKNPFSELGEE
jgi:DNA-binding transcriptional ArsR family regulator